MGTYVYRALKASCAYKDDISELSDLRSIEFDLHQTIDYCKIFMTLVNTHAPQWPNIPHDDRSQVVYMALVPIQEAAVVRYIRANKGGARRNLPKEIIAGLSARDNELHNFIVDLRDKHIAHCVSAAETYFLKLYFLKEDPQDTDHWSIGWGGNKHMSLGPDFMAGLSNLATLVRERLLEVIKIKDNSLLSRLKHHTLGDVSYDEPGHRLQPLEVLLRTRRPG